MRCPKHGDSQRLDIIRQNMIASQQSGPRLPGAEQRQAAARACTQIHISALAGAPDQVNDIALDGGRDIDLWRISSMAFNKSFTLTTELQRFNRMPKLLLISESSSPLRAWIAHPHAQQETVKLRLRQRERPFIFDRVLRGKHHERSGQRMGDAIHSDLAFLHGFEQAAWVLGVARFTSSARTICPMIGPGGIRTRASPG